jgi:non-ribosomal peptide synthase protein (TIGR01720 family)
LKNTSHFNQAVLLAAERRLEWRWLEASVARLLREHDALRLRFSYDAERAEWQQQYADAGADGSLPLLKIDLSALATGPERAAAMAAAGTQLQASLDIEAGPLLRLGVFELGAGEPQRLLWCIHHLAVDGVSWRILLADWQAWYEQAERGDAEVPAVRSSSYGNWALALQQWAQSAEAESEAGYWLEWGAVAPLPVDHGREGNTVATLRSVATSLSAAQTEALLQQAPAVYHTRINDLLLTALGRAFGRWSGMQQVLLEMEGHGREPLESAAEELELTRTVGWFTSLYPLRLRTDVTEEVGAAIKRTKEELRGVPRQGLSYGAVRYLSEQEELRERLAAVGRAEVSFNYLGQLDQALPQQGWLHGAGESSGASRDESQQRSHLLDIGSSVQGGRLQVVVSYSSAVHERESIERLAESYRESLVEVIEHCSSQGAGGFTPSDFPLATISQKQLDLILKKASKRK